jgi:SH3-like domain-containing protein
LAATPAPDDATQSQTFLGTHGKTVATPPKHTKKPAKHHKTKTGKAAETAQAKSGSHTRTAEREPHHPTPPHKLVKLAPLAAAPVVAAAVATKPPIPATDPAKGTDSGLPLPRFVALRSDQVSFRAGPGTRYPIDWVYQRRDLPVKVEREFEVWRLVSEPDGTKGWVHEAMLTGRRGFLITGDQPQTLRSAANDTSPAVAILKPGVVGRLLSCPAGTDWCQAEVKTYKGYLNRAAFWGALPGEAVNP